MKYKSFIFENYKGISEKITIDVADLSCLVGNNESGKTTILKGIKLIGNLCEGYILENGNRNECRPKSDSFTDTIILGANIVFSSQEKNFANFFKTKMYDNFRQYISDNEDSIVQVLFLYKFENSQFVSDDVKIQYADKFANIKETAKIKEYVQKNCQKIIYYDDFEFDVPKFIRFISNTNHENKQLKDDDVLKSPLNKTWQTIFDDLLNGASNNNEKRSFQENVVEWAVNSNKDDYDTPIQRLHSMNTYLNKVVNNDWKDITGNKATFDNFLIEKSNSSPYFVDYTLQAKTNTGIFKIYERSKGCRWFFCFKINTEIRSNRDERGVLFLLDEPASNLHIHPQEKILESLVNLSKKDSVNVIYSTHSPFLIDSFNLNNTYIVRNNSIDSENRTKIQLTRVDDIEDTIIDLAIQPIESSIYLSLQKMSKNNDKNGMKTLFETIKLIPKLMTVVNTAKVFGDNIYSLIS